MIPVFLIKPAKLNHKWNICCGGPRDRVNYKAIMRDTFFIEPNNTRTGLVYDPAFQVSRKLGLRLKPAIGHEAELADYLSALVSTNSQNLTVHIQRICLYFDLRQAELLYAALIDLWIAFNGRGRDFFHILLLATKERLKESDFEKIHAIYMNTELRAHKIPSVKMSVLNQGLSGYSELVSLVDNKVDEQQRDPLVEALEYLEYSQVEQALSVLEAAVLENPTRDDLQKQLLEIYVSTLDLYGLNVMEQKLKSNLLHPAEWEGAAKKIFEIGGQE